MLRQDLQTMSLILFAILLFERASILHALNCSISPTVIDCSNQNPPLTTFPAEIFSSCSTATEIYFNNNALTSIPSATFACFVLLERLEISNNLINDFPSDSFSHAQLTGLTTLNLSHNRITRVPCEQPLQLTALRQLNLENNLITSLCDGAFSQLSSLVTLRIAFNNITSVGVRNFQSQSALELVDFSSNRLATLPPELSQVYNPLLTSINMSDNDLTIVPSAIFADMTSLASLDLSHNRITLFQTQALVNLPQLSQLHFGYNPISTLETLSMVGLPLIAELAFASNGVTTVASIGQSVFANMTNLHSIDLSQNQLTAIVTGSFTNLPALASLDVSQNRISLLQSHAISDLTLLASLNLGHNPITAFEDMALSGLPLVTQLLFPASGITTISSIGQTGNAFANMVNLAVIDLSGNQVKLLPPGSLSSLPALKSLDLTGNQISAIVSSSLAGFQFLSTLQLAGNPIARIEQMGISNLPSLVDLGLPNINTVTSIASSSFYNLPLLAMVNLSHNLITNIPACPYNMTPALTTIDFSHNAISGILSTETFACVRRRLVQLNLNFNAISTVSGNAFGGMPSLQILSLSNNNITAIPIFPADLVSLSSIDVSYNGIINLSARTFLNLTALASLDLSGNELNAVFTREFSFFGNNPTLRSLMLRANQLTWLPSNIFSGLAALETIDLGQNRLKNFPAFSDSTMLRTVDFSTNEVSMIPYGAFFNLTVLSLLDLSFNQLNSIGPSFFSTSIAQQSYKKATRNLLQGFCLPQYSACPAGTTTTTFQINLEGNPVTTISKSAFDTLPSNINVRLGSALPSCCGAEWMLISPRVSLSATVPTICNDTGRALSSYTPGQSVCTCKQIARNASSSLCFKLLNQTSVGSTCQAGCPSGFVPYQTGTSFSCREALYGNDTFLLFESACQECVVANCSDCQSGITACDACHGDLALLQLGETASCVQHCPDRYRLDNSTLVFQCAACLVEDCRRCDMNTTICSKCLPNLFLLLADDGSTHCYATCPAGYQGNSQLSTCVREPDSSMNLPYYEIVAVASVGCVVLLLIGWAVYRRYKRAHLQLVSQLEEATETLVVTQETLQQAQETVEHFRREWEINHAEMVIGDEIGKGAFGRVHRGVWRGIAVAIKTMRGTWRQGEQFQQELDHEASMLRSVRHANIVQFFGAGVGPDGTSFIVTELMELGTLTDLLRQGRVAEWPLKTQFTLEIAAGMALVQSLGKMHRDLKSNNVLVTATFGVMHVKVSDFGTATLIDNTTDMEDYVQIDPRDGGPGTQGPPRDAASVRWGHTRCVGTPLWMAPEILNGSDYGQMADVWSFAIVMWEIATQQEPWAEVPGPFLMTTLSTLINGGTRPAVSPDWPLPFTSLMQHCWQLLPRDRPTFAQIVAALSATRTPAQAAETAPPLPLANPVVADARVAPAAAAEGTVDTAEAALRAHSAPSFPANVQRPAFASTPNSLSFNPSINTA